MLRPGSRTFAWQLTSRFLTHPGNISRTIWSENKASFIQCQGVGAAVKEKVCTSGLMRANSPVSCAHGQLVLGSL